MITDEGKKDALSNELKRTELLEKHVWPVNPASLSNPFLNNLFNHQDFHNSGSLKEIFSRICESASDYSILVPSAIFMKLNFDQETGKSYMELAEDLEFILSHIIRVNATKEPRIRTHKEFTTLNNKVLHIQNDKITSVKGFKHQVSLDILRQSFFRGFSEYMPFGVCFHIIHINTCLTGKPKLFCEPENLLTNDLSQSTTPSLIPSHNIPAQQKLTRSFELIMGNNVTLSDIYGKLIKMLNEYTFEKCNTVEDLTKSFLTIMKRGSAIFNTVEAPLLHTLLQTLSQNEIREYLYDFLEKSIYEKFWNRFIKVSQNSEDFKMDITYDKLKWLSITQVNLPEEILNDNFLMFAFIKRVVLAIKEFKTLDDATHSSQKCQVILNTVQILSSDTKLDADNLILLFIFVICLSKVKNLNNHLKYIHIYSYSEKNTESGLIGYALSTFEISVKYFYDYNRLQELVSKSLQNEVLWRLINAVSSDQSSSNKQDDEIIFRQLEQLLEPFNNPHKFIPLGSFIRSRTLEGESCLMYALRQQNAELMNVLLQFEYIFTLDDILDDRNAEGSNLLAVALDIEHPSVEIIAHIILQATTTEIKNYINNQDSNGRTVGHFLHSSHLLIPDFGLYIDWNKRDVFGNTPLMVYIRCYDHPKYDEMMSFTLPIVKQWYTENGILFSHRDHLDRRRNTLMHIIRDAKTLDLFLKTFRGLEMNFLNDQNQSAVSLGVRYNRSDNVEILINDSRVCLGVVDSGMFMSALDYVKLERWGEPLNRQISEMLERSFILTEYGEDLDIACVRARFEPEYGLCCYFRVTNKLSESDLVLIPFSSLVKAFKLMKKETPSIPFEFSTSSIWFPDHLNISMKGNIASSNKMKINFLINNINLLIQALYKNGTLEYTEILQHYLLTPQEPCKLNVRPIDERDFLKKIYLKRFGYKKSILSNKQNFRKMLIKPEDIIMYEAFLDYTINELEQFADKFHRFYKSFTLSDAGAKELDKLRTDIPWIVNDCLLFRESRLEDSSDIFLDKIRLLYATVNELIKVGMNLRSHKVKKWKKVVSDLRNIRNELDRIAGGGVDGSSSPSPYNGPTDSAGHVKSERNIILSKVFKQIDILTGDCTDENHVESFRNDIIREFFKGKYSNASSPNMKADLDNSIDGNLNLSSKKGIDSTLAELINMNDTGIGSWFVEKKRISYVRKLLETFLKYRIEIVEIDLELRNLYEHFAIFVSKFYQFRIDIHKSAYGEYAKGKIAELKREVQSWELWLRQHKNMAND